MGNRQRIDAQASISSKKVDNRSDIATLYQQGSARIRFPNVAVNDTTAALQAVLINTAGGLTGDDRITWEACAQADSHLTISTAACEKIYRSHGPDASQHTSLRIGETARLEWLPQETIVFNGARLARTLTARLEPQAEALLVESLVFGRQAMQEQLDNICLHDRWRIYCSDRLVHAEDFRLDTRDPKQALSPCIMHQYSAISTLVLINNRGQEWLDNKVIQLRQLAVCNNKTLSVGASVLPQRLVVRVMATDSYRLRKFLIPCVKVLNEGRPVPTVWNV